MKLIIERFRTQTNCDKQTLGFLFVVDNGKTIFTCNTLELPDLNNQKQKSCIPIGKYKVTKRNSAKYGDHFHILDVPNRDFILIHQGNYHAQIEGCVLVGSSLSDINKDGLLDVVSSVDTMKKLNSILPKNFELEIL